MSVLHRTEDISLYPYFEDPVDVIMLDKDSVWVGSVFYINFKL